MPADQYSATVTSWHSISTCNEQKTHYPQIRQFGSSIAQCENLAHSHLMQVCDRRLNRISVIRSIVTHKTRSYRHRRSLSRTTRVTGLSWISEFISEIARESDAKQNCENGRSINENCSGNQPIEPVSLLELQTSELIRLC
jgi:hypothetical protein